MSIRFAGSRSLDERRRRRIASETEELAPESAVTAEPSAFFGPSRAVREARTGLTNGVPFRKFISPKLWKHWAVGIVGVVLASIVLFLGYHEESIVEVAGPQIGQMISLSTGRLASCFNSLALLLSGQVAVIIFWARARSQEDFSGRFKIWIWAFIAWFLGAAVVGTNAHFTFSETVLWISKANFWQQQTLCWLLPVSAFACVLLAGLNRDVAGCRSSRTMLWASVALLCFSLAVGLRISSSITPRAAAATQTGAAMLGYWSLFLSMLLHARHVIYVTSEPPEIRDGVLKKLLKSIRLPKISLRRNKAEQTDPTSDEEIPESEEVEAKTSESSTARETADSDDETEDEQQVEIEPNAECEEVDEVVEPKRKAKKSAAVRIDADLDQPPKPNLKGLSKRQRREAMKQWREEVRMQS